MIPDDYREAHEATDVALSDAEALLEALFTTADAYECKPAVMALIRAVERTVKEALECQTREWEAMRALYPVGAAA